MASILRVARNSHGFAVFLAFCIAAVGSYVALNQSQGLFFGEAEGEQPFDVFAAVVILLLSVSMVLGITANAIVQALARLPSDSSVRIRSIVRQATATPAYWKAMCVSPLVFAAVYTLVGSEQSLIVSFLVAFENGYFWQSVLELKSPPGKASSQTQ